MTAAERAVDLILSGLDRWADEPCDPVDIVERLMADPALLVDLAIEAGALEPGEPWAEYENPLWWADGSTVKVDIEMSRDEFFRRTTTEDQ